MYQFIISLPFYACLFSTVELVLCLTKRYNRSRAWMLPWAIATTLLYGTHYVFFSKTTDLLPFSDTIYCMCNLSVYPLYLLYIGVLTNQRLNKNIVRWLLCIVSIAALFATAIGWLYSKMSDVELKIFYERYLYADETSIPLTGIVYAQAILHNVCRFIFGIQVIATTVIGSQWIRRYNCLISQLYADTEDKEMSNMAILFKLLVMTSFMSVAVNFLGRGQFLGEQWVALPALCFSVLLYAIGYVGRHQAFSIEDIAGDEDTNIQVTPDTIDNNRSPIQHDLAMDDLIVRFHQLVDEEEMFLQPNLKLDDLARRLYTNRTYLLKAMRQELKMTFTEYINRKRISYAERLMQQHPDMSKTEIAEKSGYASTSSFYRCLRMFGTK